MAGPHGGMAVAVREFWQNWPKALEVGTGQLRVGICPDFSAGQYDGHPLWEESKLYYYLRDGQYTFKIGTARTHELWATCFSGPGRAAAGHLRAEPRQCDASTRRLSSGRSPKI